MPAAAVVDAAPPKAEVEHHTLQSWTSDELAQDNLLLQVITPTDLMLIRVYGDTIHQNDGTHLDGGIIGIAD